MNTQPTKGGLSRRTALKGGVALALTSHTPAIAASVPESPAEHPWLKARRLSKELSETLALCSGGKWAAHIMPPGREMAVGFAAIETEDEGSHPARKVEQLSEALCVALNGYAGGRFHVRVYPEHEGGYAYYFAATVAHDREGV